MVLAKGKQATMGFLRAPEKSASSEQIKNTAVPHFVCGLIQLKELHSESDPTSSIDFSFSIKSFHNTSFRLTAGQRQHRSLTAWALIVNSAPNPEVSLVSRCQGDAGVQRESCVHTAPLHYPSVCGGGTRIRSLHTLRVIFWMVKVKMRPECLATF